jgi:dTDP-4-amino-4,6-dideoxy-D-galactose acyltransferase
MPVNSFTNLPWDTEFFGYRIARVTPESDERSAFDRILETINSEQVRLTYFFVSPDAPDLNRMITDSGGLLVDQKLTFSKRPGKHAGYANEITEYQGRGEEKELLELALHAGTYSRFRLDVNFKNGEFARLYQRWLQESLNGTIAFKVLVSRVQGKISGLLTLGVKDDYADIGLLSVDKECSGMGIGTDLVSYADNLACLKQYDKIKVVTQKQNERACRLYRKCGFEVESEVNIYHLWR